MNPPLSPHPGLATSLISIGSWLLAVCTGLGYLMVYSNRPGPVCEAPLAWPAPDGVVLGEEHPTLLMFAHPRCPCTRASLAELDRLVAQVDGRIRGTVFFFRPREAEDGWERNGLWHMARAIPGIDAAPDSDGELARAFGAHTSGHAVVYEPDGRLAFSGGVTAARAHEGDNRGRDAIRHLANEGSVLEANAPVFGCELQDVAPR